MLDSLGELLSVGFIFLFYEDVKKKHDAPILWGGGAVMPVYVTNGPYLATFADPFNNTIGHSFFTNHAATTKIPHLLNEKIPYFKTPDKKMYEFYLQGLIQFMKMMAMGEKPRQKK